MNYDPKTYFTKRFERYGHLYVAKSNNRRHYENERAAITPFLEDAITGDMVLDFGCGPGRFRDVIQRPNRSYIGWDLVDGLGTGPMPDHFPPDTFDTAVAVFVLQHIVAEAEYVKWAYELFTTLRRGGRLVVVDAFVRDGMDAHMRPRGLSGLRAVAPWRHASVVGEYAGHWMGWLTK